MPSLKISPPPPTHHPSTLLPSAGGTGGSALAAVCTVWMDGWMDESMIDLRAALRILPHLTQARFRLGVAQGMDRVTPSTSWETETERNRLFRNLTHSTGSINSR